MNAEEGPADAEHFAQDATSNNVEDWERRGILIAPLCRKFAKPPGDAMDGGSVHYPMSSGGRGPAHGSF